MDDWRPTAPFDTLRLRAAVLARIRSFFTARGLLEVETPLLSATTASDPHLASIACSLSAPGAHDGLRFYLQTSPEFAMKRLLAAGSGPIYQISKAFRDAEAGRLHNPEFTMLEWYRPGWDHHRLMGEVDELLAELLATPPGERMSYREVFLEHAGVDPHLAPTAELRDRARRLVARAPELAADDRDGWLDLLLSHVVEPRLGGRCPTFVFDFPASQAALARVRPGEPPLAERFELYVKGLELANGYHELTDATEQERRFQQDLEQRRRLGLPAVAVDRHLIAALAEGLPPCAGVALGIDRLVMLVRGTRRIAEVLAFPVDRA